MSQKFTKTLGLVALTFIGTFADAQTIDWSPAGPIFTAGRSRNIVVDKADATGKTLFTGSTSSGIFTTTDGGLNWTPLNDQGSVRNISYMAQANDNTIYAATGEGFLRAGQMAKAQTGTGLYKLNGNLLTLVASSSLVGTVINRIACSPTNSGKIALATNLGIVIYDLNSNTATIPTSIPTAANMSGQDVKFDSNGILYCTIGNEKTGSPQTPSTQIYKSSDNSLSSFSAITPTSAIIGAPNYGRIELAIAPSNNQVIYASVANKYNSLARNSSSLKALYVSYDAGSTWGLILQGSPQLDPLSNGATIASGDYAHTIIVSPSNANQVFIGGYLMYVFTKTGGSNLSPIGVWQQIGTPYIQNYPIYLHENIHDIKIVGSDPATAKFYITTDAGIYRSIDQLSSFQPFYKGLVTGQFNSVSIQSFPSAANATTAANGSTVTANDGFIGGTGGNGLTYFSGKYPLASQETNYSSGEVYNAEFSKILPNAALFTDGATGGLSRISDVRTALPSIVSVNAYTGTISKITPVSTDFLNNAFYNSTGTPFKLWENYGQVQRAPDSLVFYNDSARVQSSILGSVATLTTQSTFTFSIGRPNKFALIDSIAIRTGTVIDEFTKATIPTPFVGPDKKDIFVKLANNYPVNPNVTIPSVALKTGPVSAAGVTLNATTGLDEISVTFTSPPFANKTIQSYNNISDPTIFYKVFATVFYKYAIGDTITILDNSISTKSLKYSFPLTETLRWSEGGTTGPKPFSAATNRVQKVPAKLSARLALIYQQSTITGAIPAGLSAIIVSKAPLALNDPLSFVRVSQSGALTQDANGVSTNSVINIPGKPIILEWSTRGTEIFYATDDNKLYRVSNIGTILDFSPSSYAGKLSTDIFKYSSNAAGSPTINPASPYRTTLLGTFTKPITSISVSKNDSVLVLTFNDPTGTTIMSSANNIMKSDFSNIGFTSKVGSPGTSLSNVATYCSLIEKDDSKKVFVGTDNGIFYTPNISAATPQWTNVNNNQLPNVQIFDIKQQTLERSNSYNSGQIFVATNGRGVWTNRTFFAPYYVSVNELNADAKKENNLSVYPNPSNGSVFVKFNSVDGETASINVIDINGRVVKSEKLGKLFESQATYSFETTDLSTGMYIVNINSTSGIKRVAKLIVTK